MGTPTTATMPSSAPYHLPPLLFTAICNGTPKTEPRRLSFRVCAPNPHPLRTLLNGRPNYHQHPILSTPAPPPPRFTAICNDTRNRAPVARFSVCVPNPHPLRMLLNGHPNCRHYAIRRTQPIPSIVPTLHIHLLAQTEPPPCSFRCCTSTYFLFFILPPIIDSHSEPFVLSSSKL